MKWKMEEWKGTGKGQGEGETMFVHPFEGILDSFPYINLQSAGRQMNNVSEVLKHYPIPFAWSEGAYL